MKGTGVTAGRYRIEVRVFLDDVEDREASYILVLGQTLSEVQSNKSKIATWLARLAKATHKAFALRASGIPVHEKLSAEDEKRVVKAYRRYGVKTVSPEEEKRLERMLASWSSSETN